MVKLLLILLFFSFFFVTNLYENYCREKERHFTANGVRAAAVTYGRLWHWFQWLNWFFVFLIVYYLILGFSYLSAAVVLVTGAAWWMLFDGILNKLRGEKFFYRSELSTSDFEHYAYPKTKIVILIISIILLVIAL